MRGLSLFTVILLFGLFSCKKHRLKDEKSILIGEWEWVYSVKKGSYNSPPFASWTDTIFPSEVSSTYGLIFLKKGKVQLIENNEIKGEYRTVFNKFEDSEYDNIVSNPKYFEIDLNNKWDDFMDGWVNSDSLSTSFPRFPFPNQNNANYMVYYSDFYKKVN